MLILAFRDINWVIERTNVWDAVGLVSYGLIFAFIETLAIFIIVVLLGFLVSQKWDENKRIALLSVLALITFSWAIFSQLYFLLNLSPPESLTHFLVRSEHPVRLLYAGSLALVLPTVLVPTLLVLRSGKVLRFVKAFTERLALVSSFYLALDLVGLVVVILRNVG
jgi:hypothetical protein